MIKAHLGTVAYAMEISTARKVPIIKYDTKTRKISFIAGLDSTISRTVIQK